MKNTKDTQGHPTQPLSPWDGDLEDTLPPTPIPAEVRAKIAGGKQQSGSPDAIRYRSYDQETLDRQDEISTPAPIAAETGAKARPPRSSVALRMVVGLCLVISLFSLALNGFLIYNLMNARKMAAEGLDAAIEALDNFGGDGFHYEYRFENDVPFSGNIPFKQDLVFPFKGEVPINTTVKVPINAGALGAFVVEVPIDTSIYVNTSVPIHVDQTIHVSTTLPVSLTIPIDVRPDDPAIRDLLNSIRAWLVQLRETF